MNVAVLMIGVLPGLIKVDFQHLCDLVKLIGQSDVNISVAALDDLDKLATFAEETGWILGMNLL